MWKKADESRKLLLNWTKRTDIILGIAQGVLYLHQDSTLKIIHRDLKASNIFLDGEMNPKISDFRTARFFWRRWDIRKYKQGGWDIVSEHEVLRTRLFAFPIIDHELIQNVRKYIIAYNYVYGILWLYVTMVRTWQSFLNEIGCLQRWCNIIGDHKWHEKHKPP